MVLPTSPASISLNQIHIEAGGSTGTQASLNDADIRSLISKASGASMSFSEWYGASGDPTTAITSFDTSSMSGAAVVWNSSTLPRISNHQYYYGTSALGTYTSRAVLVDYGGHSHTHLNYWVKVFSHRTYLTSYVYEIGGWGFSDLAGGSRPTGGYSITFNTPYDGSFVTHVDTGLGGRLHCHFSNTSTIHRCHFSHYGDPYGYMNFDPGGTTTPSTRYLGSGISANWATNTYGNKLWGTYLGPDDAPGGHSSSSVPAAQTPSSVTQKFYGTSSGASGAAYYIH